ncbi:MAG: hypothetical protein JWQ50_7217 [Caballeronia mineralivorans]|jgi:hypothetical protein|nr:hypothetical protein [Caballeronia mineralivorans]
MQRRIWLETCTRRKRVRTRPESAGQDRRCFRQRVRIDTASRFPLEHCAWCEKLKHFLNAGTHGGSVPHSGKRDRMVRSRFLTIQACSTKLSGVLVLQISVARLVLWHGSRKNHRRCVLRFRIALRRPIHRVASVNGCAGECTGAVRCGRGNAPALIAIVAGRGVGPIDNRCRAARPLDHAYNGLRKWPWRLR